MTDSPPPPVPPSRDWSRLHLWQIQGVRDLLLLALVIGIVRLGASLSVVTVPLLLGLGLAYAFEPLIVSVTRRWSWATRGRQIVVMVLLSIVSVMLLGLFTLPRLTRQTGSLIANRQAYATQAIALLDQEWMPQAMADGLAEGLRWIAGPLDIGEESEPVDHDQVETRDLSQIDEPQLRALIRDEMAVQAATTAGSGTDLGRWWQGNRQVARTALAVFGGVLDLLLFAFLTLFFWVSFSASFPAIREGLWGLVPITVRPRWQDLATKMDCAISGFIRGRLIICLIMALGYAIGWSLVGVPHALVLALVAGTLGMIPFAAGIILPLTWVLLAVRLLNGEMSAGLYLDDDGGLRWLALLWWPTLVFGLIQIADEYLLTPIIQGHSTQLDVTAIIVAIIAGGSLAGFYGMLLAIPVAACLRILWVEVARPRISAWCDGRTPDPLPLDDGD